MISLLVMIWPTCTYFIVLTGVMLLLGYRITLGLKRTYIATIMCKKLGHAGWNVNLN